ncbi:MAG: hypothetical protein A2252_02170 [Elusimicrobia bacterium RIFOXYA2_FULL_39_19]|nr:MAG: hypothetical protein A2252_02170 [Elusimicrobia bacterium RIFOXYA2_FULL_39_19]
MKKIMGMFLAVVLFGVSSAIGQDDNSGSNKLFLKAGFDNTGTNKADWSGTLFDSNDDVETGYSATVEYMHFYNQILGVGLGINYQVLRGIKDSDAKFGFMPVYGTLMLSPFSNSVPLSPYVKFDAGYNVAYNGNSSYTSSILGDVTLAGGLYWGAGFGVQLGNAIFADLMMTTNQGKYKLSNFLGSAEADITYQKFSLNVGIGL